MSVLIWILGATLLHFLWQGTVIGALAFAALRAGSRRSAQWRYLVCMLALAACALAPVSTFLALAADVYAGGAPESVNVIPAVSTSEDAPVIFIAEEAAFLGLSPQAAALIVAAWLAGVLCLGIRYIFEWQRVIRMRVSATPLLNPPLLAEIAAQVLRNWGLSRRVRTVVSHMTNTPLVVGWWRPLIIFPAALVMRMPPREFELVLLHEVAHILRRDTWMNALQLLVKIILFYHPVVHWLCRRARIERECACDDFVIAHSGSTYEYARMLVSLAPREVSNLTLAVGATTGADIVPRLRYLAGECVEDKGVQNRNAPFGMIALLMIFAVWIMAQRTIDTGLTGSESALPTLELQWPDPVEVPPADGPQSPFSAPRTRAPELPLPELVGVVPIGAQAVPSEAYEVPAQLDELQIESQRRSPGAPATHALETPPADAPTVSRLVPTFSPLPEYPLRARLDGIEGSVEVMLRIAPDGRATGLRILKATPAGVFEGPTRRALMRWRFEPVSSSEATTATYELRFALDGIRTRAMTPACSTTTASLTCGDF